MNNLTRNQPCPCGSGLKYKKCCGRLVDEPGVFTQAAAQTRNQKDLSVTIPGGMNVIVPDSLDLITPYVLQEQGDWFEDEIKFVRELLQPGESALDIGANYGLYTLSMANKVGVDGRVWAFEPASSTASFLKRSIDSNKLNNTTVFQCALSDRIGTARLGLNQNSELNSLCHEGSNAPVTENVELTTLDQCVRENNCVQIVFVKLDAEGEEGNIVKGGIIFLAQESPLIMYELKHGPQVNIDLIRQFDEIGYRSYRLIPGLNILAPFDTGELPDPYQLNLFCCKDDRAGLLQQRGILAKSLTDAEMPDKFDDLFWRNYFETKPFARDLLAGWSRRVAYQPEPGWKVLKRAIELFIFSRDPAHAPEIRYLSLKSSYEQLASVCREFPTLGRLSTFARISREFGYRMKALESIRQAIDICRRQTTITLDEPFLPVGQHFEDIDPMGRMEAWLTASLLEQFESMQSFSSYYTGSSSLPNLDVLLKTGFASPEMHRRYNLIKRRHGLLPRLVSG